MRRVGSNYGGIKHISLHKNDNADVGKLEVFVEMWEAAFMFKIWEPQRQHGRTGIY